MYEIVPFHRVHELKYIPSWKIKWCLRVPYQKDLSNNIISESIAFIKRKKKKMKKEGEGAFCVCLYAFFSYGKKYNREIIAYVVPHERCIVILKHSLLKLKG